jgi:hypothetical protein
MQVNERKIIPVVKVTKAVLSQTRMGVFFIRSASDNIIAMLFLFRDRPRTNWRTAADHRLRNTYIRKYRIKAKVYYQHLIEIAFKGKKKTKTGKSKRGLFRFREMLLFSPPWQLIPELIMSLQSKPTEMSKNQVMFLVHQVHSLKWAVL